MLGVITTLTYWIVQDPRWNKMVLWNYTVDLDYQLFNLSVIGTFHTLLQTGFMILVLQETHHLQIQFHQLSLDFPVP